VLRSLASLLTPVGRLPALIGTLALGTLALWSGHRLWLELLPAFVWSCIAFAFARSLREPQSLFERLARLVDPRAPDFIASYCRVFTILYVALFVTNAATIAVLALGGAHAAWGWFAGIGAWVGLAVFQLAEFMARKLYFRHYGRSPVDRAFARLFPAEDTARGRRSMAYLQGLAASDAAAQARSGAREPG
jgi:uncharacterized membrane protein